MKVNNSFLLVEMHYNCTFSKMVHGCGEEGYRHELITLPRTSEKKFVWKFVKIRKIIK